MSLRWPDVVRSLAGCHAIPGRITRDYSFLWDSFLEKHFGNKNITFEKVIFRSKIYGWHNYTMEFYKNNQRIVCDQIKDCNEFYYLFKKRICMNKPCYNCEFRDGSSCADLRIGDYWGNEYKDDVNGVNVVFAYTERGEKALSSIDELMTIKEVKLTDAVQAQYHSQNSVFRGWKVYNSLLKKKKIDMAVLLSVTTDRIKKLKSIIKSQIMP